jgi:hypothetical protein
MAEVTNKKVFGLWDVINIMILVATVLTNYFALKTMITETTLNQAKYNAVYDLQLKYLDVRVSKLEIEVKELKETKK